MKVARHASTAQVIFAIGTLGLVMACTGQPRGGVLPSDSPAVHVAEQWAHGLQTKDKRLFEAMLNPVRISSGGAATGAPSTFETLLASFSACGAETPRMDALVIDGTRGRERYMVIARYTTACLQDRTEPRTDTVVVHELMLEEGPKVDAWSFGRPPGT